MYVHNAMQNATIVEQVQQIVQNVLEVIINNGMVQL